MHTRDRILQAATQLLAEVGADRLRTRAVAERAGVNPALVHYHFGSMSGLVSEVVDTVVAKEAAPYLAALHGSSVTSIVQGLFGELEGVGDLTAEQMVMFDLLARATRDQATRAQVQRLLADGRQQIQDRLVEARRRGEVGAAVDVAAGATMLLALLDGLGIHRLIDPQLDVAAVAAPVLTALATPGPTGGTSVQ